MATTSIDRRARAWRLSRRLAIAIAGLAVLSLLALGARAQGSGGARVTARLSSGVVKLGGEVTLVLSVENASQSSVRPLPAVDGLRIAPWSEPSSRSTSVIVNGRLSRSDERTWTAAVRPERAGEFTIPGLEVVVEGAPTRTQPLSLNVVADLKGDELGSFTLRSSASQVVEGQPFLLELTFGWDAGLRDRINWANLSLSWWGQLPGAVENAVPPPTPGGKWVELLMNSESTVNVEELANQTVRGRPFRMFRLVRSFTATRAGTLEFPAGWLEFARVEDTGDFFTRRRERVESFFVRSQPLELTVLRLPEEGRPADFGGAIGRFQVRASADPRDVDAGESIKLKVEWTGDGNLSYFSAPEPSRSESFRGFRVYGMTESKSIDRRTVVYDLAPRSAEVTAIPPLELPVFDPSTLRYTVLASEPIPIHVRALARASGLEDEDSGFVAGNDVRDLRPELRADADWPSPGRGAVIACLAAAPLIGFGLLRAARRRADPAAPAERRRRRARRELAKRLATESSPRAQLDLLHEYLGARSGELAQAWEGRDVVDWFSARRPTVAGALVDELRRTILDLEAAAWGGGARSTSRESTLDLARRLEEAGL